MIQPSATGDITIRAATAGDIERMRAIEADAGELFRAIGFDAIADGDPPSAALLSGHINAGTAWVAATSDGCVVGYATASVIDGEAHLDQVSIVGAVAGRGIGQALIERVVDWGRGRALPTLTLTTFRDVPWNGPYYGRLGFAIVPDDHLGPELARIRRAERLAGIEIAPRVAMRRPL